MNTNNIEIIKEMEINQHLSPATVKLRTYSINKYTEFHDMSMHDLLLEADEDEDNRVRMKRRRIKQRLQGFQAYLVDEKYSPRSINTIMSNVLATYHFYEIETPVIHQIQNKRVETFKDIPSRKDIKEACNTTNKSKTKAMILFMCSSGCARTETLSLTVGDYIEATREYHSESSIGSVVNELKNKNNVVPTWRVYRQKTNTPYFTFCTPEATKWITKYLDERMVKEDLTDESQLFKYTLQGVSSLFRRLNDNMGGVHVNGHAFFRSHSLRKFFATTLINSDMDSMTIDFLSGRKISSTHEAYFKADPRKLKNKYMMMVDKLTILEDVRVHDLSTYERRQFEDQKEETRKLKQDVQRLRVLVEQLPH